MQRASYFKITRILYMSGIRLYSLALFLFVHLFPIIDGYGGGCFCKNYGVAARNGRNAKKQAASGRNYWGKRSINELWI